LARGLIERGIDVVVFCRPASAIAERLEGKVPFEPILSGHDFDPLAIRRCRAALRRHHTQIVITQKDKDLRLSGIAAWTLGIPVLVRHVTDRPLKNTLRYRFLFGKVATHHMANSAATRDTLLRSAPWLHADVPIIHNGIDVAAFANAPRAALGLPADAVAVGYIGAFELRKGILDFAEAWPRIAREVPNAHAVIAGKGAREAEFRARLQDAPRVHWLGFRNDVGSVLKALDIFVLPSRFEGFGLVLAEAMAAGVAPVAYAASNIPELVEDDVTGLLAEPGNAADLGRQVVRLARHPELRQRIGLAAQSHASQHFSGDRMVVAHATLLRDLAAWW
ncbi:MAG TPA: glycosyltransferase family 4 protein, partial [Longimicrobiales bacterium]